MLHNWSFQLTLINFFGIQLFTQIIAFPVEADFKENKKALSKRLVRKILPYVGAVALGGAGVALYNHQTSSSNTVTAPGGFLSSTSGGPSANPFPSSSGDLGSSELGVSDPSLDAGLDSPVVKRDLQGKETSTSDVTVRDLYLLPHYKTYRGVESSAKRGVAAFSSIVIGSAVMNLFSGIFKGHQVAPVAEPQSDEQTEINQTSLKLSKDENLQDDDDGENEDV